MKNDDKFARFVKNGVQVINWTPKKFEDLFEPTDAQKMAAHDAYVKLAIEVEDMISDLKSDRQAASMHVVALADALDDIEEAYRTAVGNF
jgi:hypothetical protein